MSDNEGEGPSSVQFRGLSTHYVATDNMLASFRYPAGSYSARTEDWVGLFEEGATAIEQFLARADVKNTATHRPCDGGLWKSGKVVLKISQLQGPLSSGYYRLWYISHETGDVVGQSATFTLCRDMSEFPSITIKGCEDHALLNSLREQSPISVCSEHCISSSFVLVEDEGWSWDGEDPPTTPPADGEEATAILESALEKESLELTTPSPESSETQIPCADQQSEQHSDHSRQSANSLPESRNVSGTPKPTENLTEELGGKQPDHGIALEAPPGGGREGPPSLSFLQEASLTSSTVVVHSLSQSEAWRIKNNNKELWAKVQKLDAGMEGMQRRQRELEARLAREETEKKVLQERVSELVQVEGHLRGELRRAEKDNQELSHENTALQERVGELQTEVGIVSQHCTQLVEKVSEYETQLAVARSEQEVLRQRQDQRHKGQSPRGGHRRHHGHHSSTGTRQVGSKEETARPQDIACSERRQEVSRRKEIRPQYSTGSRVGQEGSRQEAARPSGGRGEKSKRGAVKPQQPSGRRQEECKMSPGVVGQTVPPSRDQTSKSPLSEERISEITAKLKGSLPSYTCPICGQQLPSHESEYSAQLHVERCLANQDAEG